MANTIRFSELVKKSGRPVAVTLWVDPEKDAHFQNAVKENRVLTVRQETVGNKKDFGTIGFSREKNSSYFIFPKALPGVGEARVVGIKYDLLDQPAVKNPVVEKKPKSKAIAAQKEKEFTATVKRTAVWETTIQVCAKDSAEARAKVESALARQRFPEKEAVLRNEIREIHAT